jgi:hypothetical protein
VDFQQSVIGLMSDYNEVVDKSPYQHATTYATGANVDDGTVETWIVNPRNRFMEGSPSTGEIYLANHPAMNLGTGDFTIEWWQARPTGQPVGNPNLNSGIMEINGLLDDGWWILQLSHSQGGDMRIVYANTILLDVELAPYTGNGEFEHVAFVRENGTLTLYHKGIARGSVADSTDFNAQGNDMTIGGMATLAGYMPIDDVRVTKDARYSGGSFSPPNEGWT